MEFRDLKRQYQAHRVQIDNALQEVIDSTHFIMGEQVARLEKELAGYTGVKHCIACGNGTDALQLTLMAWGIGPGDAVFVPDFTLFSSGEVVPLTGATPVFVDIDRETYNISIESLQAAVTYVLQNTDLRPKVVVAVDLFGQPADYDAINKIVDKYHLLLLEDGAQGFGGSIRKQKACSFGNIAITSFFPAKPLGCYGDGGAVFTDNDEYADILRSLRVHGKGTDKYDNIRIGVNSRLDTLQAAILLEKLKFFDEEIGQCNLVAAEYSNRLKEIVKIPVVLDNMVSSWAQYTICLQSIEQRTQVMQGLRAVGIPSAIYYKKPMHCQEAFKNKKYEGMIYPITEKLCSTCLSLPMHAYLEEETLNSICDVIVTTVGEKLR